MGLPKGNTLLCGNLIRIGILTSFYFINDAYALRSSVVNKCSNFFSQMQYVHGTYGCTAQMCLLYLCTSVTVVLLTWLLLQVVRIHGTWGGD